MAEMSREQEWQLFQDALVGMQQMSFLLIREVAELRVLFFRNELLILTTAELQHTEDPGRKAVLQQVSRYVLTTSAALIESFQGKDEFHWQRIADWREGCISALRKARVDVQKALAPWHTPQWPPDEHSGQK